MKTISKKIIATSLLTLSLSATLVPAFGYAGGQQKISGGWSESQGYYINNPISSVRLSSLSASSSSKPDSHKGYKMERGLPGDEYTRQFASHGETVWYGMFHYTTAQMTLTNGTVKTTSGQQWDDNATEADSPWYTRQLGDNTLAKTYWGN